MTSHARFMPYQKSMSTHDNKVLMSASKTELLMGRTSQGQSAGAEAKMFLDKRKQSQGLITINCSKATPSKRDAKAAVIEAEE